MLDYQIDAIRHVREYAKAKGPEHQAFVAEICEPFEIDIQTLIDRVLHNPITINFHPDRFSNNGKVIIENLIEQGIYQGQFHTGTTNGGRTAHVGGDRFSWEQRLFFDAYPQDAKDRPKYGALNLFRHIDGASARFGSCFFTLKHEMVGRCTFAYGDSATNPTILCTSDTFIGVLAGLFDDFINKGKLLNQVVLWIEEVLAILLNPCNEIKDLGKNLNHCIETHIHGDVLLNSDIDSFYVDSSFQDTLIGEQAHVLCEKYGIALYWIPKRQIAVDTIGNLFRGPMIPLLAKKIDQLFGRKGFINAELIGQASRDSFLHPERWEDMGGEPERFQHLKQLWHTVGYFG